MIRKLLKVFIPVVMIAGLSLIGYAVYEIYTIKNLEDKATAEAEELLRESRNKAKIGKPLVREEFEPEFGSSVGMLTIDKIDANLPIVAGTHEDDLRKGVGHYEGTAFPMDDDQIVLSGHRDTVFTRMGEIEIGDILTMRMPYGDFEYEVTNLRIVDQYDLSVIVPHDEETLTVTTCYPFNFVGSAPDRYIVDAKPIYDKEKMLKDNKEENESEEK